MCESQGYLEEKKEAPTVHRSIHLEAVEVFGRRARIEKWRSEVLEKLFAIDRYLEGKGSAEDVLHEHYDDLYVSQSLAHIPEFAPIFNQQAQVRHRIEAERKLQKSIDLEKEK